MPRDEFISLVPPPKYEIKHYTSSYNLGDFKHLSSNQRMLNIVMPLGKGLTQLLQKQLHNVAINAKFDEALMVISDQIQPGIDGFLFKVTENIDPIGTASLPVQPISFIGFGKTPIDAIAKSLQGPTISQGRGDVKNRNHYRWCTRDGKSLEITCSEITLSKHFESTGKKEALRRSLQAIKQQSGPTIEALNARGQYWKEVFEEKKVLAQQENVYGKLLSWHKEMESVTKDFEKAYNKFVDAQNQAAEYQKQSAFWGKINAVLGVISATEAIQSRATAEHTLNTKIEAVQNELNQMKAQLNAQRQTIINIDILIIKEMQQLDHNSNEFKPPVLH